MEELVKQIEALIKQNTQLLELSNAQGLVIDELKGMVEDLTEAVNNLSLPYGDGYSDVN